MNPRKFSLRTKLMSGLLGVAAIGMTIAGVTTYLQLSSLVLRLVQEDLGHRVDSLESAVKTTYEDSLERQRSILSRVARETLPHLRFSGAEESREVQNQVTSERVETQVAKIEWDGRALDHSAMDQLQARFGSAVTLFVRSPAGLVRIATSVRKADGQRAVGTFIPPSSAVYREVLSGKPYFGRAQVVGAWYVAAYQPLLDSKGEVKGALFVGTPDTSTERLRNYLKAQKILETGYFYVMDSQGKLLLHPKLEGQNVIDRKDVDGRAIFREILDKRDGSLEYRWQTDGEPVRDKLAVFRYFEDLDWHVAASLNLDEVKSSVYRLRNVVIATTLAVLLLMGMLIGWIASRLSKTLQGVTSSVSEASQKLQSSSRQIGQASHALTDSSTRESAAIQQTAASMEEIGAMLSRTSGDAASALEISRESRSKAIEAQRVVDRMSSSMGDIQQANSRLERLVQLIAEITAKTKVIDDIVMETRLLSFNASIEAARAGVHGKGFAVVAEEVGKLASMSGKSSAEIRELLDSSSRQVSEIVSEVQGRVAAGNLSAAECESAFREMSQGLERIDQAVNSIASATREQQTGIRQTNEAMGSLERATGANSEAAIRLSQESGSLTREASALVKVADDLGTLVFGESSSAVNPAGESALGADVVALASGAKRGSGDRAA